MDAITILSNLIPAELDAGTVFSGSSSGKKVKGYTEATPSPPAVDTNYIFHEQVRDVAVWFIDRFDPLYVYGPPLWAKPASSNNWQRVCIILSLKLPATIAWNFRI